MTRMFAAALCVAFLCVAQQAKEQQDLEAALAEAGSSPMEYLRALEKHLAKYPDSPRKAELERAATMAAVEAKDDASIIRFGERVLARQPSDLQMLSVVTQSLLASDARETSARALTYARRYEELARQMQRGHDQWAIDRAVAHGLQWEARATGNLGRTEEALALAERAFETDPSADAAREIARWHERLGQFDDAARSLADAFTIPDPRATDTARALDRARMGELYRKAHGSEAGLGDLMLAAYDRNLALIHARELAARAADPNIGLTDPMAFTLSAPGGGTLKMETLKGKVVILDFWATWCGPCRVQHPLYEQVKQRFRDRDDVVFLSIDTDEDRATVKPFLADVHWDNIVYYEDGLSRALKVTSIPTTIVIDKNGKMSSRMNGFVPEKFVEMLAARIRDALGN